MIRVKSACFIFLVLMLSPSLAHSAGLTIGSGCQMALNDGSLNVGGDVAITGIMSVGSGSINLTGNWSNGGTFTPGTGTVTFNGINQSISGTTTFYNLTKNVTTAATLIFQSGSAGKTIIENTLNLQGISGQLLSLRSGSTGSQWEIDPQGTRAIQYLDVKDSNNINTTDINAVGNKCTDSGNNTKWSFQSPTVTTQDVTGIGSTSATGNGNITNLGSSNPTAHGVCWNTSGTPTTGDNKTDEGAESTTGAFTASITGLAPGTSYYVRAYATNSAGTSYGNQVSFTTGTTTPTVTTTTPSSITSTTASSGGNITSDGGSTVTDRGICWSTLVNPTTADNKISAGPSAVSFTLTITGLNPGTAYHVRAYAVNSAGTAYGSDVPFTTNALLPTVTTTTPSNITTTTATSGGNVTADGGSSVTARGVCWSTSTNPTISDSKTTNGSGTGTFTSGITGLTGNTQYHVRAYATNSAGTAYGQDLTFAKTTDTVQMISMSSTQMKYCPPVVSADGNATINLIEITLSTLQTVRINWYVNGQIVYDYNLNVNSSPHFHDPFPNMSPVTIAEFNSVGVHTATIVVEDLSNNLLALDEKRYEIVSCSDSSLSLGAPFPQCLGGPPDSIPANFIGDGSGPTHAFWTDESGNSISVSIPEGPFNAIDYLPPSMYDIFNTAGVHYLRLDAPLNPSSDIYVSDTVAFDIQPCIPTITSFVPTSGTTGTPVTIYGTNLTGATAVKFGGTAAASFTVDHSSYITAAVGSGSTGKVTVTTPGGTADGPADFTFTATSTAITGTVTNAGGQPVVGVGVCAQPFTTGGQTWWCANTQSDGTYTIAALPGYARVHASGGGYLLEYYNNSYDEARTTAVWVTAGQTTPNINFSLGRNGSISGTVYKADGTTPLPNVCVDAYRNQCGSSRYAYAQTDTNGAYTISDLPPQTYYIKTRAACTSPQHYANPWWNSSGPATFCDQAGAVTVASEQNTSGINFSLSESDATYPGPSYRWAGVYASHNANGSITTVFYAFIYGPSPEDVVSVTVTGPSGTFNLVLNQAAFRQSGHFYSTGSGSVVDNGIYTFVVTDSLGRTATVTRDFTYDSTIPQVDSTTMTPVNQSYTGTVTPTLSWAAVTWPGTPGYYQIHVYDYDGQAIWYNDVTDGTSITIPEGYLQPDSAYYWWVRTGDIPATGERGQNRHLSNTLYFYTGTKGLPDLGHKVSLSFTTPDYTLNWFATWSINLAPWDINSFNVTGPKGTVYPYTGRSYFFQRPAYYRCHAFGGPIPTPDGTYTFQLSDTDSNTNTQTQDFIYNPVPTVSEASRSPAPNAYTYGSRTFSWDPVADSRTLFYKLRIRDYNSRIVWYDSPYITETSWTIPDDIPIGPNGPYKWQVLVSDRATAPNNLSMSALRTITREPLSTNNYTLPKGTGVVTDYRIFTAPYYMGSGANLLKQMESVLGPYDQTHWRVFGLYEGNFIELNSSDFASLDIVPGIGLWIITLYDNTVQFEGTLCPQNTTYERILTPGWQMIALPWPGTDITLGSITVSDGSNTYAITDDANTLTQTSVWDYTGSGPYSGYEKRQSPAYALQRGVGYYLKVLATTNVTITVPPSSSSAAEAMRSTRSDNDDEPPPGFACKANHSIRASSSGRILPLPPGGRIDLPPCSQCSGSETTLVLEKEEFLSETPCQCTATESITIGSNVNIRSGANVTFKAPRVNVKSGFHAEAGAEVNIKQE